MALVGDISGSSGKSSRIGVTGSVVFAGADPDINVAFPDMGNDVAFYVSGSASGKDNSTEQGVSVFGGDVVVSGTLVANMSDDGAYSAIKIDKDYTGTTTVGNYITDASGLLIDYDVTGIVASGQTALHDALAINYNQDSPTHVGNVLATGADIRMTGGTSGAQSMKGVAIVLAGADTNTGIDITIPNDGTHFIARSPDNLLDNFIISVGESGATTLSTSDQGASVGNLTLDADGKIIIEAVAGDEVVFNEAGANVDFRVESQNEDEAIFLDASGDALHINKGKSAFSTKIWSNSDNALEVNSSGVTLNEQGHATNDFRVESDTKTHALFIDAGTNQVILGASSCGTDTVFHVSGTKDTLRDNSATDEISVFAGDLVISGNLISHIANDYAAGPGTSNMGDERFFVTAPGAGQERTLNLPGINDGGHSGIGGGVVVYVKQETTGETHIGCTDTSNDRIYTHTEQSEFKLLEAGAGVTFISRATGNARP